jgi:glutamyl-tRNA synthetase
MSPAIALSGHKASSMLWRGWGLIPRIRSSRVHTSKVRMLRFTWQRLTSFLNKAMPIGVTSLQTRFRRVPKKRASRATTATHVIVGSRVAPGQVLRFRVPAGQTIVQDLVRGQVEFSNDTIEDFVLLRSNGSPMFLLANVVDDIEMKVSNVVRAEEHLPNTPKQQMIWDALGHTPPIWAHVPVLVNEQRKKLSKRRDKVALEQYREEGILPDAMVNYLMTLGWAPAGDTEIVPWQHIVDEFRLEDVNHSPAFFDIKKLNSFNGDYVRAMSLDEFIAGCAPHLENAPWPAERFNPEVFAQLALLVQTRVVTLSEVPAMVDFVFFENPVIDEEAWTKTMGSEFAINVLRDYAGAITSCEWNHDALKAAHWKHGLRQTI